MTQKKKLYRVVIEPKLVSLLLERAHNNHRNIKGEVNAILTDALSGSGASVTQLFPERPSSEHQGPLDTHSGYRGVYKYGAKWAAGVHEDGKRKRIGAYADPKTAALAYDEYVRDQSGGMAPVNFPREGERSVSDPSPGPELDEETQRMIEGGPMGSRAPGFDEPPPPPGIHRVPLDDPPEDSA